MVEAELEPEDELFVLTQFHEGAKGTLLDLGDIRADLYGQEKRSYLWEESLGKSETEVGRGAWCSELAEVWL